MQQVRHRPYLLTQLPDQVLALLRELGKHTSLGRRMLGRLRKIHAGGTGSGRRCRAVRGQSPPLFILRLQEAAG